MAVPNKKTNKFNESKAAFGVHFSGLGASPNADAPCTERLHRGRRSQAEEIMPTVMINSQ